MKGAEGTREPDRSAPAADAPTSHGASAASLDDLAIPDFLDRSWLRLTTAQMFERVHAALAEVARRQDRAAKARRRAVARGCARALERDRKRRSRTSRKRWAAWKAQQKEQGCG